MYYTTTTINFDEDDDDAQLELLRVHRRLY